MGQAMQPGRQFVRTAITATILMPAPPTDTTEQTGSSAVCSLALVRGSTALAG